MRTYRRHHISARLTGLNLLVSAAALLMACAAFATYDWIALRASMARNLSIEAQIIGTNSTAALLFDEPKTAEGALRALTAGPTILSAAIYTADGKRFASYGTPGTGEATPAGILAGQMEAHWFGDGQLVLARKIFFEGTVIGFVTIRSDLSEMYARRNRYAEIAAGVLLLSMLGAVGVSWMTRSIISHPIIRLAETARTVTREHNYAIRAQTTRGSLETAQLIESFNEMLEQIQQRDARLLKAREELERGVKERTAQLEAANRELESFSYSVSHDLRAPLRSIDGFSQALLEEYGDALGETGKNYLDRARKATQRMSGLIDDLLNLARVTRTELTRGEVDLSAVANAVRQDLEESEPQRRVEWLIGEGLEVEGDSHLLQVMMQNLLGNAWKYTSTHEHARIEFGLDHQNGEKTFFVRDDGAGFDPAYSSRLFGVFQRLHSPSEFPGTGIGLATVQRIVLRHGGKIWAKGEVEKGATFYFQL